MTLSAHQFLLSLGSHKQKDVHEAVRNFAEYLSQICSDRDIEFDYISRGEDVSDERDIYASKDDLIMVSDKLFRLLDVEEETCIKENERGKSSRTPKKTFSYIRDIVFCLEKLIMFSTPSRSIIQKVCNRLERCYEICQKHRNCNLQFVQEYCNLGKYILSNNEYIKLTCIFHVDRIVNVICHQTKTIVGNDFSMREGINRVFSTIDENNVKNDDGDLHLLQLSFNISEILFKPHLFNIDNCMILLIYYLRFLKINEDEGLYHSKVVSAINFILAKLFVIRQDVFVEYSIYLSRMLLIYWNTKNQLFYLEILNFYNNLLIVTNGFYKTNIELRSIVSALKYHLQTESNGGKKNQKISDQLNMEIYEFVVSFYNKNTKFLYSGKNVEPFGSEIYTIVSGLHSMISSKILLDGENIDSIFKTVCAKDKNTKHSSLNLLFSYSFENETHFKEILRENVLGLAHSAHTFEGNRTNGYFILLGVCISKLDKHHLGILDEMTVSNLWKLVVSKSSNRDISESSYFLMNQMLKCRMLPNECLFKNIVNEIYLILEKKEFSSIYLISFVMGVIALERELQDKTGLTESVGFLERGFKGLLINSKDFSWLYRKKDPIENSFITKISKYSLENLTFSDCVIKCFTSNRKYMHLKKNYLFGTIEAKTNLTESIGSECCIPSTVLFKNATQTISFLKDDVSRVLQRYGNGMDKEENMEDLVIGFILILMMLRTLNDIDSVKCLVDEMSNILNRILKYKLRISKFLSSDLYIILFIREFSSFLFEERKIEIKVVEDKDVEAFIGFVVNITDSMFDFINSSVDAYKYNNENDNLVAKVWIILLEIIIKIYLEIKRHNLDFGIGSLGDMLGDIPTYVFHMLYGGFQERFKYLQYKGRVMLSKLFKRYSRNAHLSTEKIHRRILYHIKNEVDTKRSCLDKQSTRIDYCEYKEIESIFSYLNSAISMDKIDDEIEIIIVGLHDIRRRILNSHKLVVSYLKLLAWVYCKHRKNGIFLMHVKKIFEEVGNPSLNTILYETMIKETKEISYMFAVGLVNFDSIWALSNENQTCMHDRFNSNLIFSICSVFIYNYSNVKKIECEYSKKNPVSVIYKCLVTFGHDGNIDRDGFIIHLFQRLISNYFPCFSDHDMNMFLLLDIWIKHGNQIEKFPYYVLNIDVNTAKYRRILYPLLIYYDRLEDSAISDFRGENCNSEPDMIKMIYSRTLALSLPLYVLGNAGLVNKADKIIHKILGQNMDTSSSDILFIKKLDSILFNILTLMDLGDGNICIENHHWSQVYAEIYKKAGFHGEDVVEEYHTFINYDCQTIYSTIQHISHLLNTKQNKRITGVFSSITRSTKLLFMVMEFLEKLICNDYLVHIRLNSFKIMLFLWMNLPEKVCTSVLYVFIVTSWFIKIYQVILSAFKSDGIVYRKYSMVFIDFILRRYLKDPFLVLIYLLPTIVDLTKNNGWGFIVDILDVFIAYGKEYSYDHLEHMIIIKDLLFWYKNFNASDIHSQVEVDSVGINREFVEMVVDINNKRSQEVLLIVLHEFLNHPNNAHIKESVFEDINLKDKSYIDILVEYPLIIYGKSGFILERGEMYITNVIDDSACHITSFITTIHNNFISSTLRFGLSKTTSTKDMEDFINMFRAIFVLMQRFEYNNGQRNDVVEEWKLVNEVFQGSNLKDIRNFSRLDSEISTDSPEIESDWDKLLFELYIYIYEKFSQHCSNEFVAKLYSIFCVKKSFRFMAISVMKFLFYDFVMVPLMDHRIENFGHGLLTFINKIFAACLSSTSVVFRSRVSRHMMDILDYCYKHYHSICKIDIKSNRKPKSNVIEFFKLFGLDYMVISKVLLYVLDRPFDSLFYHEIWNEMNSNETSNEHMYEICSRLQFDVDILSSFQLDNNDTASLFRKYCNNGLYDKALSIYLSCNSNAVKKEDHSFKGIRKCLWFLGLEEFLSIESDEESKFSKLNKEWNLDFMDSKDNSFRCVVNKGIDHLIRHEYNMAFETFYNKFKLKFDDNTDVGEDRIIAKKGCFNICLINEIVNLCSIYTSPDSCLSRYGIWKERSKFVSKELEFYDSTGYFSVCSSISYLLCRKQQPREGPMDVFYSILTTSLLQLVKIYRKNKAYQLSLNTIRQLREVSSSFRKPEDIGGLEIEIVYEEGKLLWSRGDKDTCILWLKSFLGDNHNSNNMKISKIYNKLGEFLSEMRLERPISILNDYFNKSVDIIVSSNDYSDASKIYMSLAKFSDEQYQMLMNSPDIKHRKYLIEYSRSEINKYQVLFNHESEMKEKNKIGRSIVQLQNQLKLDSIECERIMHNTNIYLEKSFLNYVLVMVYDNRKWYWIPSVFRICSLWFSNLSNIGINQIFQDHMDNIATSKFIPSIYQLSSHLSLAEQADSFHETLLKLTFKICVDHPFHSLYQIFFIRNSQTENTYSTGSHSIRDNLRTIASQKILDRVRNYSPRMKNIVESMDVLLKAYIELSAKEVKTGSGHFRNRVDIDKSFSIYFVKDLYAIPVCTRELEVDHTLEYNDFISVKGFSRYFQIIGGMNLPKIIECHGCDGKVYKQLVKSRDDLRQDAIMVQIFSIINLILKGVTESRKRKLKVSTYKVIPLQSLSGLIEWISDTIPIGDYLSKTHERIYPDDIKPIEARNIMKNEFESRDSNLSTKLFTFHNRILAHFHPVMRYFFMEISDSFVHCYFSRDRYIKSVASYSIIGYIVGLGDRHCQNILLNTNNGEIIHIDLNLIFDQGRLLKVQERVPFRCTRDIVDGFGPFGIEGQFRRSCEEMLQILRNNKFLILAVLDVFKHDPLYRWKITKRSNYQNEDTYNLGKEQRFCIHPEAERSLLRVREKLNGIEFDSVLSLSGHINYLLQEATNPESLCQMYPGWQSWM